MYTSEEACGNGNFLLTFNAECSKDESAAGYGQFVAGTPSDCAETVKYVGPEGCKTITFEAGKVIDKIAPFLGIVFIVIGVVFTFFGAQFLFQLFGGMVCLLVFSIVSAVTYNLFMGTDTKNWAIIALLVVSALLGIAAAWFSASFAKDWAVALLAAWGGLIVGALVAKSFTKKESLVLCAAVIGGVVGGYLGKNLNKLVRCLGTAFLGSAFILRGVMFYV